MNDDTLAQLLLSYYGGDNAALDELHGHLAGWLFGIFRKMGCSQADAEDRVQDVFFKVMETRELPAKIHTRWHPGGASVRTWLHKVARNVLSNYRRKEGRRRTFSDPSSIGEDGKLAPSEDGIPDKGPAPYEQALTAELEAALRKCVSDLPDREYMAIILYFGLDEYSTSTKVTLARVARELRISNAGAYRAVQRALALLRECLRAKGLAPLRG